MSHCNLSPEDFSVTILESLFMCFLHSFLDFWFLCYTTVAWSSNYLEQKSQQFFQKTESVIIWHLNYCFHKNRAALSVARIGLKHTHSVKTAKQIPLTETPRGPPENVLFTTLRLNRKCTAFPQDSAENGFPMSGGMQSGACVFLAVNIRCQLSRRDQ